MKEDSNTFEIVEELNRTGVNEVNGKKKVGLYIITIFSYFFLAGLLFFVPFTTKIMVPFILLFQIGCCISFFVINSKSNSEIMYEKIRTVSYFALPIILSFAWGFLLYNKSKVFGMFLFLLTSMFNLYLIIVTILLCILINRGHTLQSHDVKMRI